MLIEWSDEDQAYLVILPEWAGHVLMPVTHGETYSEAVKHGQEVLEMLVKSALQDGESLPAPKTHAVA
ncbi:MAG TPA: type II toxin-antitoxin system HicB family antitoxin [Ktedonobacteraceae bacterium]|nr:type II toxin-antitoxin system HicB family antitoxin [Ktedonobacteraceae bacterium]